jgi:hypothetical protein
LCDVAITSCLLPGFRSQSCSLHTPWTIFPGCTRYRRPPFGPQSDTNKRSRARTGCCRKQARLAPRSLLSKGEPEFPPTVSLVVATFNGRSRLSFSFAWSHDAGSANGSRPVLRRNAPPIVVTNGPMPSSFTGPLAWPNDRRSVPVASGYAARPRNAKSALAIFSPPLAKGASTFVS